MAHSTCGWNAECAGIAVIPWRRVLYLSTLETLRVEALYKSLYLYLLPWEAVHLLGTLALPMALPIIYCSSSRAVSEKWHNLQLPVLVPVVTYGSHGLGLILNTKGQRSRSRCSKIFPCRKWKMTEPSVTSVQFSFSRSQFFIACSTPYCFRPSPFHSCL